MEDVQAGQTSANDDEDQLMDESRHYDDGSLQLANMEAKQTSTEQAMPPLPSPVLEQKGAAQVPSSGDTFMIQR